MLRNFSTNRMYRLYRQVYQISRETAPKLKGSDKLLLKTKTRELEKIYKRSRVFYVVRSVAYLLLYLSIISAFVGNFIILKQALNILAVAAGIAGTSVLVLILAVCQKMISLYLNDAHLVSDYIISLGVKYSLK